VKSSKVAPRDRKRVDALVHCYNEIDGELRRRLRKNKTVGFFQLVAEFERDGACPKECALLKRAAELRNFVVHEPKHDGDICTVPTAMFLRELAAIKKRLIAPEPVIPRFAKSVVTISPVDTLAHVLREISVREFSQFPVYNSGKFKGLLTENGITRWLAKHVQRTLSLVDVEEVYVSDLLREEEQRNNYHFVAKIFPVEEARRMFREKEQLEAVLITAAGQRSEPPLGIITRWDMLH
jgi:predicted transcriptional regulator